jgi:hypothetical protein
VSRPSVDTDVPRHYIVIVYTLQHSFGALQWVHKKKPNATQRGLTSTYSPIYRTQMLHAAAVAFNGSTDKEASGHVTTALEMLGEQVAELAVILETIEKAQMSDRCRRRREAELARDGG